MADNVTNTNEVSTEAVDESLWEKIKKLPNTISNWFAEKKQEKLEAEIKENADANKDWGKDMGNTFLSQAGTAVVGAGLFGVISNKLSGGNKLWTGIGGLAGAVIMHKVGPELITDIQRGFQYVDQQKALGKSEGKFTDKLEAVFGNIKVSGQEFAPTTVADPDPDIT